MTRCARCGRSLKYPSESGYGPRCQLAVLGSKPKREKRAVVKRDERTPDLFAEPVQATWLMVVNLMVP